MIIGGKHLKEFQILITIQQKARIIQIGEYQQKKSCICFTNKDHYSGLLEDTSGQELLILRTIQLKMVNLLVCGMEVEEVELIIQTHIFLLFGQYVPSKIQT